jgi:hypothetical protein
MQQSNANRLIMVLPPFGVWLFFPPFLPKKMPWRFLPKYTSLPWQLIKPHPFSLPPYKQEMKLVANIFS